MGTFPSPAQSVLFRFCFDDANRLVGGLHSAHGEQHPHFARI
jgi:hypothetical protein